MTDVKGKLVEQKIKGGADSICPKCFHSKVCRARDDQPCVECNQFVDANGVTIQRWIPVAERLPEMLYDYTHDDFGETVEVYRSKPVFASDGKEVCIAEWVRFSAGEIPMEVSSLDGWIIAPTHWMPLPEPPKEE